MHRRGPPALCLPRSKHCGDDLPAFSTSLLVVAAPKKAVAGCLECKAIASLQGNKLCRKQEWSA